MDPLAERTDLRRSMGSTWKADLLFRPGERSRRIQCAPARRIFSDKQKQDLTVATATTDIDKRLFDDGAIRAGHLQIPS
jgi:hypothetical protein